MNSYWEHKVLMFLSSRKKLKKSIWERRGCHSIPPPSYVRGLNELGDSICYGEPVGSTTLNSFVRWQIKHRLKITLCASHSFKSKQHNKSIIQSKFKLLFYGFVICHFTQYLLSVCVQPFLACTWFEVATNKIAQFFGTGTAYVKLKKKSQFFDYNENKIRHSTVIPRNKTNLKL